MFIKDEITLELNNLLKKLDKIGGDEDIVEQNAVLYDVIELIEEANEEDEDWEDEIADAVDELNDLTELYKSSEKTIMFAEELNRIVLKITKA